MFSTVITASSTNKPIAIASPPKVIVLRLYPQYSMTVTAVSTHGGVVSGVAMLVDRSDGTVNLGAPTVSLIRLHVEAFHPDKLPPDLAAIPAIKPGSK